VREAAAATDYRELQKLVEAKKWKQAEAALQAFKKAHETTRLFASKSSELTLATTRIDENTRLEKGLIGWWKLDEMKGEFASDSSGNKNHGKLEKGAAWTRGKLDGGVLFDGLDDYLEIPTSETFNLNGALTVAAWYRHDGKSNADYGRIVGKAWPDAAAPFLVWALHLDLAGQKAVFALTQSDKTATAVAAQQRLPAGQWCHVAGVFDPAGPKIIIYINGVKDGEKATKLADVAVQNTPIRMGDDAVMNQRAKGAIDDVRIYNRALTETEIQALANGRK